MADAAKVAALEEAMRGSGLLPGLDAPIPSGDTVVAKSSEEPAVAPVTPEGTPVEVVGSDVVEPAKEPEVEVPAWLAESAKEAWKANPALRDAVAAEIKSQKDGIMADATEKWMKAAELREQAKDAIAFQANLKADPAKWDAIQKIVTPPAVPVDPIKAKLVEMFGEDAGAAITEAIDKKATEKAKGIVHETVHGPLEHKDRVNATLASYRQALGNRITEDEWTTAMESVAVAHGWTPEDPDAAYRSVDEQQVVPLMRTALIMQQKLKPQASPPKALGKQPASVKSTGMASGTTSPKPWETRGTPPTKAELRAETLRRNGVTAADVERMIQSM